jgi:hypothetical protein
MEPVASFSVFRALDGESYQNLLNYASSRTRSVALAFLNHHSTSPDDWNEAFLTHFVAEIVCMTLSTISAD